MSKVRGWWILDKEFLYFWNTHDKNVANIDLLLTHQFLHFPVTLAKLPHSETTAEAHQRLVKSQGHQEIEFLNS